MIEGKKPQFLSKSRPSNSLVTARESFHIYPQSYIKWLLWQKLAGLRLPRSRKVDAIAQNQLPIGLSMRVNSKIFLSKQLISAVELNQQPILFNSFFLGFLYLWLGVLSHSALAEATERGQLPENSVAISINTSSALQDASKPFNLSTSATLLLPEKTAASEEITPINQEYNNDTPTVGIAQSNQREEITPVYQPANNSIPTQEIAQIDQREEITPVDQPTNNSIPTQKLLQNDQPDSTSTPTEEPIRTRTLRGNSLENTVPYLNTAHQLLRGEVIPRFRYRQSFPPKNELSGLTGQPNVGISWGVTNNLQLTFDVQTVDNGGPGNRGAFPAQRTTSAGSGNFFQELTLEAKQRLWQNSTGTQALSGVVAISRGVRAYRFLKVPTPDAIKKELVPSLELPYTITTGDRWQFTLSPKVAFLPEDNALYFRRPPVANPGSFGTTFGLAGGASYRATSRLLLWGDAFVPLTGHNTIARDSGLPARTPAFNAGLRYLVNPRLATDLFVSNSLGDSGALSMVVDKEYPFLGFGITFIPGITSANRRYASSFNATSPSPATPAGFAFLDGGTVPSGQLLTTVQGGGQGLLAAVQYGLVNDLEIGAFVDLIPGTTDESELGFSGKVRFLNQAAGDPVTLSAVATLARSNNVLINLINNNANEFEDRGLTKGGFAFSNEKDGELFIITLSTPIHYQLKGGSALWMTPTIGVVQRNGVQIAGVNFGSSTLLSKNLNLIGEIGVDFSGKGNAFVENTRETVIPWSLGLRWNPSLRGIPGLEIEGYATNRLGSTPFQTLRVQADKSTAIGVGVRLPLQF